MNFCANVQLYNELYIRFIVIGLTFLKNSKVFSNNRVFLFYFVK